MKISDLVMFAEVDLVSMYPDSASAHDKKEWNNSVTRKCSNTSVTFILVLKTNWCIEIYWTCLNHPINNPLRSDSQNLPSDCLQQFHANEDFRFSDALQHDKKEWNNSVVALKCSKTSVTSILHLRFPFPILPSWLLKHWALTGPFSTQRLDNHKQLWRLLPRFIYQNTSSRFSGSRPTEERCPGVLLPPPPPPRSPSSLHTLSLLSF